MGAKLSLNNRSNSPIEGSVIEACKRQRTSPTFWDESPRLIPTLPDEISIQILARLPRVNHFNAKLVSISWKSAIMSEELYKLRKEFKKTEEWLYILTKMDGVNLVWHALDPISQIWQKLPLMPKPNAPSEDATRSSFSIIHAIRGWLERRGPLDRIPLCGCAIAAVDGCLYVIGGFNRASVVNSVFRYDPIINSWSESSPMLTGRAYCKTGVLNDKLYVVGGVTQGGAGAGTRLTPLQSAEVFDPLTSQWSELPCMPFSKAQFLPTAFLAELFKPIATGMASYNGKLYVPQSLYCWPFFVDVGGEVYDPDLNSWVEMPVGMGEGWPARQAGTKLSVIVENDLYALDPCISLDSGRIKAYDRGEDSWKVIEGDVAIRDLAESESPYLLAGMQGKLHVISKGADCNIIVLQADRQNGSSENIWKVVASKNAGSVELVSCQILDI